MPRYYYSTEYKAYVKKCSCCDELFIGAVSVDESLEIFSKTFSSAGPSSGMADGFQSRCCDCNTRSRRDLCVTRSQIKGMFAAQNGRCAICTDQISIERGASNAAHVDHDSNTGIVRSLLCSSCNQGIGSLKHDPWVLQSAIEYLDRWSRKTGT